MLVVDGLKLLKVLDLVEFVSGICDAVPHATAIKVFDGNFKLSLAKCLFQYEDELLCL